MIEKKEIYESGEDYLEAILMLSQTLDRVRAIDIVHKLGYSKLSVSITMWHHAYNGIPAIREPHDGNGANSALYKDDVPSGHDHLAAGCLSGEFAVKIVAASPTIPGQQTADGRVVVASRSGNPKSART